ncbi:MAG: alanine dehydrogenase [Bacteroidia bacterium]
MNIPSASELLSTNPSVYTIEKPEKLKEQHKKMKIGVPKERSLQERRVALTPETVNVLVRHGHQVLIETQAGLAAHYTDHDFSEAGAIISHHVEDLYQQCDFIAKISRLSSDEISLLCPNQTIISALSLGNLTPDYIWEFCNKNITGLAFEFLQGTDNSLPLVQMMSEIAGVAAIQIAAELMSDPKYGNGILLGGVTGIPPAVITIIGAGTVGYHAAKTALGMGARVRIIDESIEKLRAIKKELGLEVYTMVAQYNYIKEAVTTSDVVIGAAYTQGKTTPVVVTEDMVKEMKEGSIIIDVAIDQGGCVDTSEITDHDHPTFTKHGVIHYCVPNIAAKYARTASMAVSNVLGPLLVAIGDAGGLERLMQQNEGVKQGIYTYRRHLTKKTIANMFGMKMKYRDIGLLIATSL